MPLRMDMQQGGQGSASYRSSIRLIDRLWFELRIKNDNIKCNCRQHMFDPKQTVFNTSVLLIQYNENKNVLNSIMLGWLNEDAY